MPRHHHRRGEKKKGQEVPVPPERAERTALFGRTKMCKFHILGCCSRGNECNFAHDPQEMNPLPDLTRTKLCKTLINTGSCDDPDCKYAHNKDELRGSPPPLPKSGTSGAREAICMKAEPAPRLPQTGLAPPAEKILGMKEVRPHELPVGLPLYAPLPDLHRIFAAGLLGATYTDPEGGTHFLTEKPQQSAGLVRKGTWEGTSLATLAEETHAKLGDIDEDSWDGSRQVSATSTDATLGVPSTERTEKRMQDTPLHAVHEGTDLSRRSQSSLESPRSQRLGSSDEEAGLGASSFSKDDPHADTTGPARPAPLPAMPGLAVKNTFLEFETSPAPTLRLIQTAGGRLDELGRHLGEDTPLHAVDEGADLSPRSQQGSSDEEAGLGISSFTKDDPHANNTGLARAPLPAMPGLAVKNTFLEFETAPAPTLRSIQTASGRLDQLGRHLEDLG